MSNNLYLVKFFDDFISEPLRHSGKKRIVRQGEVRLFSAKDEQDLRNILEEYHPGLHGPMGPEVTYGTRNVTGESMMMTHAERVASVTTLTMEEFSDFMGFNWPAFGQGVVFAESVKRTEECLSRLNRALIVINNEFSDPLNDMALRNFLMNAKVGGVSLLGTISDMTDHRYVEEVVEEAAKDYLRTHFPTKEQLEEEERKVNEIKPGMEHVWGRIYKWPEDRAIGHSCTFTFGYPDNVTVWPQYGGGTYEWIIGKYYWKRK